MRHIILLFPKGFHPMRKCAVGMFFMLSGYHKLFNAPRHRMLIDEFKALGAPAVGINQSCATSSGD